jgi:predicted transcriptional regulator
MIMSKKISIILDDEVIDFLDRLASNHNSFINDVLLKEKQKIFMQQLADSYKNQAHDLAFQEEIAVWDVTAGDGLNA